MTARWAARAVWSLVLAQAAVAAARPGGGHSFSSHSSSHSSSGGFHSSYSGGGGSHYYSGGSYGGGDASALIALVVIGAIVLIVVAIARQRSAADDAWASMAASDDFSAPAPEPPRVARGPSLDPLRAVDPKFSAAVFEDFAFQLYAALQRARADATQLAALAPYISARAAATLAAREHRVAEVVVGALRIETVGVTEGDAARARIGVRIESNLVLGDDARTTTLACVEHWEFARTIGPLTQPPVRTRTWPCPNCGAPWAVGDAPRICSHCGEAVTPGRFDWAVEQIWLESQESMGTTLTGTVEERGTELPTVRDRHVDQHLTELATDDPAATWDAMSARFAMIYARLNTAWNASDLTAVRGLCTGALLDYLKYWLDEYKRQQLHNTLDDAKLARIEPAKLRRDPYYDALTVRIVADGLDFTTNAAGKVVGGSRDRRRPYTEYWTFLRSASRRGTVHADPSCPACGAPLQISDIGTCDHCGAQVENGDLDWVLSKIEQDEVYRG